LDSKKVQELLKQLVLWTLKDNKKIEKIYSFKNFKEAMAFINKVGNLAEEEGHHPDIEIFNWNKTRISLSTHAIGGLSENDFILAAKIDEVKSN